ncbi:site-specific integrase [Agrilactobacillus fermenti]|uniref:site-specific integrase n=1 Tax=Agrilactobacillus fermenti TaxID=2586909 RepID=UPI001E5CEE76|nr:tyrosine-type recombinase/integrase [Agrilactobacillus fermenti]MCD2257098.1 tyrosine-type recombinase/integrase [Agrilactobacillus fermenti]
MRKWKLLKRHPNIYEYETRRGKRYGLRRGFTTSEGKKEEYTKSGFLTWRDADVVLKKFEVDLSEGKIGLIATNNITLDAYFNRIAQKKYQLGIWKDSTRKTTTNYYRKYLKPRFGKKQLDEISRSQFQDFLDNLATKGLAKSTIRTITSVMLQVMNDAEHEDIIYKNRLKGMLIRGREPKDLSLEPKDFDKWIKTANKILDRYLMAFVYVGTLGERRGELMGLRSESFKFGFDDVHQREICSITFDLQRTSDFPNGTTLKTKSSYRTIWVCGEIIDYIKFALQTADNLRMRNNISADTKKWVWLNDSGEPFHPTHLNRVMHKVEKASGIHITPHMLRHYFATEAISSNTPQIDVMHWLGHKNIQMTADYTRPNQPNSLKVYSNVDNTLGMFDGTK